jgi:hypothetical protein
MDPKSIAHLDPKLQETYARVMGTPTSPAPTAAPQSVPADQNAPAEPTAPTDTASVDFSAMNAVPTDATPSLADIPQETTPANGSEPSLFSVSPPLTDPHAPSDLSANSSFFTNPTPAQSEPPALDAFSPLSSVTPTEPADTAMASDATAGTPVTPYTPAGATDNQVQPAQQPFAQPLPSPADVNQTAAHHETSPLLKVFYIIGAVVFLAIYTIFWIKVFNLPFLF